MLPKISYSAIVQNRPSLKKHNFDVTIVDGDQIVNVPDEILEGATPLWEDLIIGRFPSTAPHVAKVHVIVNKIWPLGDKTVKIDAYEVNANTIKFRIRDSSVRARVLRRGMWNIADMPMLVSKWSPVIEDAQPEIKTMPMWVTLLNVPHTMFSWEGISFLSSAVGEPKRLHPDTELCKSFEEAKVFVEVDLSKDLPKSFRFKSDKGVDATVDYKYPWLPPRCSSCSKWGHLQDVCLAKNSTKTVLKPVSTEAKRVITIETETISHLEEIQVESTSQAATHEGETVAQETLPLDAIPAAINLLLVNEVQDSLANDSIRQISDSVEESWHDVSPTKTSRQRSNTPHEKQDTLVSPSRFSLLATEEDIESEEGEIENEEENSGNLKVAETQDARPSLPRVSKTMHKVIPDSRTHNTKKKPSVSGRRVYSRKH